MKKNIAKKMCLYINNKRNYWIVTVIQEHYCMFALRSVGQHQLIGQLKLTKVMGND
jgi:hypothetical protein